MGTDKERERVRGLFRTWLASGVMPSSLVTRIYQAAYLCSRRSYLWRDVAHSVVVRLLRMRDRIDVSANCLGLLVTTCRQEYQYLSRSERAYARRFGAGRNSLRMRIDLSVAR